MVAENIAPQGTPAVAERKHTEVAVGILLRDDGAMLLSTRPPGKPYAGYWEFPGGKLEAGETVEQALRRELIEELGVTICLLYTSPSPRDRQKSRMPSSA